MKDQSGQLALFSSQESALSVAPLEEPLVRAEDAAVAQRLSPSVRLGTMSWTYPGWLGVLYAPGIPERALARRGLSAYAQHPLLRMVEIDRSYYEPLSAETFALYASQVPEGFRFLAKAHADCTTLRFPMHARHGARQGQVNRRILDVAYATDAVVAPFVTGLGSKAGPLVFQFPPQKIRSAQAFAEKLHGFLRALPKGPTYAVEVRNRELLTPAYGAALADTGALHCHNAWEHMPGVLQQRNMLPEKSRRMLLVRWLTRPGDTHEAARARFLPFNRTVEEDPDTRAEVLQLVTEAQARGAECALLVSNKAEGCAPESVFRLARAIADAR